MIEKISKRNRKRMDREATKYREYGKECDDEWCYRDEFNVIYGIKVG